VPTLPAAELDAVARALAAYGTGSGAASGPASGGPPGAARG